MSNVNPWDGSAPEYGELTVVEPAGEGAGGGGIGCFPMAGALVTVPQRDTLASLARAMSDERLGCRLCLYSRSYGMADGDVFEVAVTDAVDSSPRVLLSFDADGGLTGAAVAQLAYGEPKSPSPFWSPVWTEIPDSWEMSGARPAYDASAPTIASIVAEALEALRSAGKAPRMPEACADSTTVFSNAPDASASPAAVDERFLEFVYRSFGATPEGIRVLSSVSSVDISPVDGTIMYAIDYGDGMGDKRLLRNADGRPVQVDIAALRDTWEERVMGITADALGWGGEREDAENGGAKDAIPDGAASSAADDGGAEGAGPDDAGDEKGAGDGR